MISYVSCVIILIVYNMGGYSMGIDNFETFSFKNAIEYITENVDSVLIVDAKANSIRPLVKRGIFKDFIDDSWTYNDLIAKLWYHFNNSSQSIDEKYHVFLPTSGKFLGKYSKRIKFMTDEIVHIAQMTIYPVAEDIYIFILDELDRSMYHDEDMTNKKVDAIQNIYLFSMYIDIVKDTTSSISVTEISDETMNQQLKYSDWRMMIVNMIAAEYQKQFLAETDPENLKKKYAPGQTSSFDCMMMNLEGVYIWVKLIFCRSETSNDDDYRFVFMVQNIHENAVKLQQTLKQYEQRASMDSLTGIFNHGRIETELSNAIAEKAKDGNTISIMMLDIDFFKNINDQYGHSVGDITLVHFTKSINDAIKDRNAVLGRWGGEEFVVICYDTPAEQGKELAETIRRSIETEKFEKIEHMTCSIGLTEIKAHDTCENAFERMDRALYQAKSEGRNCVRTE